MRTSPILVRTIREQIVDHLRQEILCGSYKEGAALREQLLAAKYGVSRGPIRDALLQLTKEGLLMAEPNRGVKVRPKPSEKSRALLVKIRREIEVYALREIFSQIGPGDIAEWEANLESFKTACKNNDMPAVIHHDMAFHRSILQKAGDEVLVAIWLPLITHLVLPYSRHQKLIESYEEHCDVFEAIKAGNLKKAIAALEANIQ